MTERNAQHSQYCSTNANLKAWSKEVASFIYGVNGPQCKPAGTTQPPQLSARLSRDVQPCLTGLHSFIAPLRLPQIIQLLRITNNLIVFHLFFYTVSIQASYLAITDVSIATEVNSTQPGQHHTSNCNE